MATFKQMSYVRAQYPDAKIYVFYIDLRTPGKYEKFREERMNDTNAFFIKGKVAQVNSDADGGVTVIAENAVTGDKVSQKVDLAVLATGMQPELSVQGAPFALKMDNSGFVISDTDKGIIAAGCAKKAADVVTTTQSSTAAALKAIQVSRR
jgi:quinone-modifying oxidoreductase subunit QmoA